MTTVKQLLDQKGHKIHSIHKGATVLDAIRKMADNDVGSLLVMEGDKLIGLVTERHYARNVFLKGKSSPTTMVEEIMQTHVLVARPEQTVEECMAVMTKNRVRHLPVADGSKIGGIVSIGDLVNSIIADQKFVIDQLEHYIRN
ncbi:MAG: CBS domain-containing protein [Proteobacteria bacterium]|nr:CBS domain-containing protein [Pseudomonadota bacterium]MBI3498284.1 CBS domain-containing protein [Pseudomonadota bacterium]